MELGLSLGDASKSFSSGFMDRAHRQRPISANFCMGLSIGPIPIADDDGDEEYGFKSYENGTEEPSIQLDLLPSTRLSSGEGSSEAGLDVNRSPNSGTSSFQMELGKKRDSADEDDENGNNNARKKLRLSKEQSAFLEETFKEHNTLNTVSSKQKLALAKRLNLRPRQVEVWFQNRRARTKLKQTEVECEYLKRCCDTLTEENRRLHKELHQLRAMSTSNPFKMQPPATTLTMCPSCERVATNSNPKPPTKDFMG